MFWVGSRIRIIRKKPPHLPATQCPARCQGADQLTKDLLSLFSKVPDSFKKQYQAGKSSEKLVAVRRADGSVTPEEMRS